MDSSLLQSPGDPSRASARRPVKRKRYDDEFNEMGEAIGQSSEVTPRKRSRRHQPLRGDESSIRMPRSWLPDDDRVLLTAVQQGLSDFKLIAEVAKFSRAFSTEEVEQRWRYIFLDPDGAAQVGISLASLPPMTSHQAVWSQEEDMAIREGIRHIDMASATALHKAKVEIFHSSRTPKNIADHARLIQLVDNMDTTSKYEEFQEQEKLALAEPVESEAPTEADKELSAELFRMAAIDYRKVVKLEKEVDVDRERKWAPQALAVLRGTRLRHFMSSQQISIGRSATDFTPDIDLTIEGPVAGVSRLQALLRLQGDGDFILTNVGRPPIFINGQPLLSDTARVLPDNCLIEVCELRMIFEINKLVYGRLKRQL